MLDLNKLGELGAVTLALILAIMAFDLVRKKFRQTENGDRRKASIVVECPNKIEGLAATLELLAEAAQTQVQQNVEHIKLLQLNKTGIDRLVDQHKPVNGVETWKASHRIEELLEDTCVAVKELVREIKRSDR